MEIITAKDAELAYKSLDDWQYADREAAWKWMFERGQESAIYKAEAGPITKPLREKIAILRDSAKDVLATVENKDTEHYCFARLRAAIAATESFNATGLPVQKYLDEIKILRVALEDICQWTERYTKPDHPIVTVAKRALLHNV